MNVCTARWDEESEEQQMRGRNEEKKKGKKEDKRKLMEDKASKLGTMSIFYSKSYHCYYYNRLIRANYCTPYSILTT